MYYIGFIRCVLLLTMEYFHSTKQNIFSHAYPSSFEVEGLKFNCMDQFLAYYKALFFGDTKTAKLVMKTKKACMQKSLVRALGQRSPTTWLRRALPLVYWGNVAKFRQNPKLLTSLIETRGKLLCQVSPHDFIWSTGRSMSKLRANSKYSGANCMGHVLTQVREDLMKERGIHSNYKLEWTIDTLESHPAVQRNIKSLLGRNEAYCDEQAEVDDWFL